MVAAWTAPSAAPCWECVSTARPALCSVSSDPVTPLARKPAHILPSVLWLQKASLTQAFCTIEVWGPGCRKLIREGESASPFSAD